MFFGLGLVGKEKKGGARRFDQVANQAGPISGIAGVRALDESGIQGYNGEIQPIKRFCVTDFKILIQNLQQTLF